MANALMLAMANFFVYSYKFVFPGSPQRFGPDSVTAALNLVNILSTLSKCMLLAKFPAYFVLHYTHHVHLLSISDWSLI